MPSSFSFATEREVTITPCLRLRTFDSPLTHKLAVVVEAYSYSFLLILLAL